MSNNKKYEHKCPTLLNKSFQNIDDEGFNGESVAVIYVTDDGVWVGTQSHYEYGSAINFCPYCGRNLGEQYRQWVEAGLYDKREN